MKNTGKIPALILVLITSLIERVEIAIFGDYSGYTGERYFQIGSMTDAGQDGKITFHTASVEHWCGVYRRSRCPGRRQVLGCISDNGR